MASNSENYSEKDVDLFYLIRKIGELFDRLGYSIYKFFLFFKRNFKIILILLIAGIVIGYFLDSIRKDSYRHEIIVIPNFGSTSYLYDYIDQLSLKDSPINKVKIEPIVNVYELIKERYQNLEVIKQLSSSNINYSKFEKNSGVEQYYRYHLLTFYTDELDNADEVLDNFFGELNSNPYYLNRQKIEIENTEKLIKELNLSIDGINNLMEKFAVSDNKSGGVNLENYPELNELVNVKKNMTDELSKWRIYTLEQNKIIFDTARFINIKERKLPLIFVLPLLFIFGFFGIVILKNMGRHYKAYESK